MTPETDRGIASLKHPNKLKETSMARLLDTLVSVFGRHNSAASDILTYAKTEYKKDWQHEYRRLLDQYHRTGEWTK